MGITFGIIRTEPNSSVDRWALNLVCYQEEDLEKNMKVIPFELENVRMVTHGKVVVVDVTTINEGVLAITMLTLNVTKVRLLSLLSNAVGAMI